MENEIVDVDELLHLAVKASNAHDIDKAIAYLKRAISIAPNEPKAYYFLGALHAEIGMYDRAIAEMTRATELDPDFLVAYFQIGQIHITLGDIDSAENIWKALDSLGEKNFYFLFKRGMLNFMHGDFNACIEDLREGITLNNINASLSNDMQRLFLKAEAALAAETGSMSDTNLSGKIPIGAHDLSAYQAPDKEND